MLTPKNRSHPVVSVVIPAYNAENFLSRTLQSVARQTYRDFEIIVVDDGSRDNTVAVARAFLAESGCNGQCIVQENRKIAGARNTGIRASRGSFIALLDHDDLWDSDKLEKTMNAFRLWPDVDLICHNERILQDGRTVRITHNHRGGHTTYVDLLLKGNTLSPSAVVFREKLFEETQGFDENPSFNTVEDYDFWLRVSRFAIIRYLPEALGSYVLVDSAASNQVLYHHENLMTLLSSHLQAYLQGEHGWLGRLRARRRISEVYRSALSALRQQGVDSAAQQQMATEMIRSCFWDFKNVFKYLEWRLYAN